MIVSKDSDMHQRSFVFGHPPKVIWVRHRKLHYERSGKITAQQIHLYQTILQR
jgi:predicted nuclease of predicted toxin-antitoxin system